MKALAYLLPVCCLAIASVAAAHEYPLSFTPNSGARGLVVAGYQFQGNTVVGNCSYYTSHYSGGRGGHTVITHYNQTCTWDLQGNLLSIAQGAPAAPTPLYTSGTQTVYALGPYSSFTGSDSALAPGGFVNTPGSHYSWTTSNAYAVIPQALHKFTATLTSDGDVPLTVSAATASALNAPVKINKNTCTAGPITVGATCGITVTYDPTKLCSPVSGLTYDTLTISLTTDAGQTSNFVQGYTVTMNMINPCED